MSDVMAKIQTAEQAAKKIIDAATLQASNLLSDAQSSSRKATESIKEAVLKSNATALIALEKELKQKGEDAQKATVKKVSDMRKAAEKKIPALVKDLVASVAQ